MELDAAYFRANDEVPNMRSAQFADLEVTESGGGLLFDGYAAVFGEPTDMGDFTEEIKHGAFRKVLASGVNVPLLHEHKPDQLLATTKSGRMRLYEEPKGLRVTANLADTDLSRRVKTLVESGDVQGMSFGFICGTGNSDISHRAGKPHRLIKGFRRLIDVTTTWDPAYASAEAQFRSLMRSDPKAAKTLQQLLRSAYPAQLEDGANEEEVEVEEVRSGVSDTPRLAARKRRLAMLSITLEGGELE